MATKNLFILLCISLMFLSNIKSCEAIASKTTGSHIIPIQNKSDISEVYPVVDEIESRVFGQKYLKEDIYKRLDRLDAKVFGSVSQKTLSDRVENLSTAVMGTNNNSDEDDSSTRTSSSSGSFSSDSENYSENSSSTSEDESLNNLLNQLEKKLLNQVYPNDETETRVARLERFLFNDSSSGYSMNERMERIATVVKAQPTNEIYQDAGLLNSNKLANNGLGLATIILMIVAGLLL